MTTNDKLIEHQADLVSAIREWRFESASTVAATLGVSRATVYRVLADDQG